MVVTALPPTSETRIWHEKARLSSIWTMQAPQRPVPQPNLVPVSLSSSRITHNSGMSEGASECAALPLTLKSSHGFLHLIQYHVGSDVSEGTRSSAPGRRGRGVPFQICHLQS